MRASNEFAQMTSQKVGSLYIRIAIRDVSACYANLPTLQSAAGFPVPADRPRSSASAVARAGGGGAEAGVGAGAGLRRERRGGIPRMSAV